MKKLAWRSARRIAGAPVALEAHARAERPGLDQLQRDVFGDRRQERRAATDGDRMAEHAQLVDEAELDRRRRQAGPGFVVAQRRIRLPHEHRLVQPAAAQIAAELAYLREVEA